MGWVVVVVIVVVLVGALVLVRRSAQEPVSDGSPQDAAIGLSLQVLEFIPTIDDATVVFNAPLPDGDVGDVLRDLLFDEALRFVHEKRRSGLPIDGITSIRVVGIRKGERVDVGILKIEEPGDLPEPPPVPLPHLRATGDPFRGLTQEEMDLAPKLKDRSGEDGIEPVGEMLRFSERVDAGLRLRGVDPSTASLAALTRSLFELAGYSLNPASALTFVATRDGVDTYVEVVPHRDDEYPELRRSEMTSFVIDFQRSRASRGVLVTEKFGPFDIYDMEKRVPEVRFVPNERLQAFVDSFALDWDS
ncbi:hypothetical protein BMS3Bbin02_01534 [bacterium BMS3Bbin02]|nr:hypothetical protein BMS3Bbin02_01534 [bacterium BMS3Bbin02]